MSILLCDLADQLQRASERRNARVILVIDQFEELLGHEAEGPDPPANRFLELLRATVDAENCPLVILGTMRSDFLGAFQRNPALEAEETGNGGGEETSPPADELEGETPPANPDPGPQAPGNQ